MVRTSYFSGYTIRRRSTVNAYCELSFEWMTHQAKLKKSIFEEPIS